MTVGRRHGEKSNDSIGILSLSSCPDAKALEVMSKIKNVQSVMSANLPKLGDYPAWMN